MKKSLIFKVFFQIFLIISLSFIISISNANLIYAQEEVPYCCQREKNTGRACVDTNDISQCEQGKGFQGRCEDLAMCKPVCCDLNSKSYFESGGQGCYKNVGAQVCADAGGNPIDDPQCNVAQCGKGCCIIGGQSTLTTEEGCFSLTNELAPDPEIDFREDITNELECLDIPRQDAKGCCVVKAEKRFEENSCKLQTFAECNSLNGNFYEGVDCVDLDNQAINSCKQCESNNYKTGCASDLGDRVYYYDKCDNPILNLIPNNGDCKYSEGQVCKEKGDNSGAECRSLNCDASSLFDNPFVDENFDGNFENDNGRDARFNGRNYRLNGESWCEYDADAGPTRDLPGTRHYVHYCYEGKEYVDECEDYRDEFCLQFDGLEVDVAKCIENKAASNPCAKFEDKESCENPDLSTCIWVPATSEGKEAVVKDLKKAYDKRCKELQANNQTCAPEPDYSQIENSDSGTCLPSVPPGFRFGDPKAVSACSLANPKESFKTYWSNVGWGADWDCDAGCKAYTQEFAYDQNTLCRAQGDCGADYNLAGDWSDNGFTRSCAVSAEVLQEELADNNAGDVDEEFTDYGKFYGDEGVSDLINSCKEKLPDPAIVTKGKFNFSEFEKYKNSLKIDLPSEAIDPGWWEANGLKFGIVTGTFIAIAVATTLAVTVGSATLAIPILTASLTAFFTGPAYIPIINIVAIIIVAIVIAITFGTGGSETQEVNVECGVWQAPVNSQDCHLCYEKGERTYLDVNGNIIPKLVDFTAGGRHDCTEYLCKSLGSNCQFVEGDDGPKCFNSCESSRDVNKPSITPLDVENYNGNICGQNGDADTDQNQKCVAKFPRDDVSIEGDYGVLYVREGSDVVVGVRTNEASVCKWDWERKGGIYDQLSKSFDQERYSLIHTTKLKAGIDINPGDDKTMYVVCQDYCGNPEGDKPAAPIYRINVRMAKMPDIGAPAFRGISPESGGYIKADILENESYQVSLKLNEGSICKWSKTNDPFDVISSNNTFPCGVNYIRGCDFNIKGIKQGENRFYIRCSDNLQNPEEGNKNVDAIPSNDGYVLYKSEHLNISNVRCLHSLGDNCEEIYDRNYTLEVTTINGAYSGRASCYYDGVEFLNTNNTNGLSTQLLWSDNVNKVKCIDDVDNEAEIKVNITMKSDNKAPDILRINLQGSNLVVLTDEISSCRSSETNDKLFDEMETFTVTGDTIHQTGFGEKDYLHVKCKDRFNHISSLDVYRSNIS
ncbi:hypothetical protein J4216_04325 [Candidatus Woesearchaeota archaeon]|nr:hypothetical protein [Candidatus Woesearchaeota archaeon]